MNDEMKTGVLLLNLGTPDSAKVADVRRYLREFLGDPRVVDLPALSRWLLLNLVILPFRPRSSAKAYRKIWTEQGSPLLIHTKTLKERLSEELGPQFEVVFGMRYGNPSIQSAVKQLRNTNCQRVVVLPLFPQYSSAATGSALECAFNEIRKQWGVSVVQQPERKCTKLSPDPISPVLRQFAQTATIGEVSPPPLETPSASTRERACETPVIICNDFFNHEGYIESLKSVVEESLNGFQPDHFVFSYHGLPLRHIEKSQCDRQRCDRETPCPNIGDHNRYCYRAQSYSTSRLLADALGITREQYTVAFQSRLGKTPWIKPYTDVLLPQLYDRGIKKIAVVCPSFVSDCLETLEEVGIRAHDQWRSLGGEQLKLIPCLNAHPKWVKVVAEMIREQK